MMTSHYLSRRVDLDVAHDLGSDMTPGEVTALLDDLRQDNQGLTRRDKELLADLLEELFEKNRKLKIRLVDE